MGDEIAVGESDGKLWSDTRSFLDIGVFRGSELRANFRMCFSGSLKDIVDVINFMTSYR